MPSNARVKQIMKLTNVERQARVSYKGDEGMLMVVKDSHWTSAVEKGMAAADAIRGTVDYTIEKITDIPDMVLKKILSSGKSKAGAVHGLAAGASSDGYKLIFVPDNEDREYLVFDGSLDLEKATSILEEMEEKDKS
jgi:hypothetical protein